jgi:hypothetical protein
MKRGLTLAVAGSPQCGAVTAPARDLVRFAWRRGYDVDELVEMIPSVA